jgi:hypothetical protein
VERCLLAGKQRSTTTTTTTNTLNYILAHTLQTEFKAGTL